MYGRYGIDDLYRVGIILYFILFLINILLKSSFINLLEFLILCIIIFRAFSKNIKARRKENQIYLDIKNNTKKKLLQIKRRWNDRNTHMYKKCPKCKTTLRLPLNKGSHMVKCPKCYERFSVKCHRNEKVKVEVIKNKS